MSIKKITKLVPQTTALFVCDVQERFKGLIWQYPSVISVAGKMASCIADNKGKTMRVINHMNSNC